MSRKMNSNTSSDTPRKMSRNTARDTSLDISREMTHVPQRMFSSLFDIAVTLMSDLDRSRALSYLTTAARHLIGARFSAVGIMDSRNTIIELISSGLSAQQEEHLPIPLDRDELRPATAADEINVCNALPHDSLYSLFPPDIFTIENYLVLPVSVQGHVWGRFILANKEGGFDEQDIYTMSLLVQAASVCVQSTRLYAQAQSRSRWLTAGQHIVSTLLEGSDEEAALQTITDQMRLAGRADVAMMVLPSLGDTWASEFVSGSDAMKYLGLIFPPKGRARVVIEEQAGIIVDSMERMATVRVPPLRDFGPMLYAPLISTAGGRGVIVLARYPNSPEFDLNDLALAENTAQQATIALELAEARRTQEIADELNERSRISRDLHDLAIQQLFASGMHITAVREELAQNNPPAEVTAALDKALEAIDDSVGQIRKIVQSLRDEGSSVALLDRLEHETKMALQSLGFAPSLLVTFNELPVSSLEDPTVIDDAVGADISDDVIAVVREGISNASRHAHASSLAVAISVTPDTISVTVQDDGKGVYSPGARRSGLSNLAARARRHHGEFSLHNRSDGHRGAEMVWEVPLR